MICNVKQGIIEVRCKNLDDCPTPSAHARMNEAHRLWHQTAADYDNPDSFRANLNACIQALRNVTFVLQKEKSLIPNFNDWYGAWQDKLRKDNILSWLVEARNVIVKEGDLETQSRVRASILSSYNSPPEYEMNVDPMMPTKEIAAIMASQNIPQNLIKHGILRVERKWISIDLPDHELLEALSHSYGVLSTLIYDAHLQSKSAIPQLYFKQKDGKVKDYAGASITHLTGPLPCMVVTDEARTVWLKLSTNEFLRQSPLKIKKISRKEVVERYGDLPDTISGARSKRELAMIFLDWAKNILLTDGNHVPIVFLELPNGKHQIWTCAMRDQSEKYIMARRLVKDVEMTGAKSIMSISEVWTVPFKKENLQTPIEEVPERSEALAVEYLSADGDEFSFHCTFTRKNGSFEFGEVIESPRSLNLFHIPLRESWRRKKRTEGIKKLLPKYRIGRNALCPCCSGKKFKKCCAPHIGTFLMDTANILYQEKKYEEAEKAYRAWLIQYIIWYNEHTVPFVQHSRQEAEGFLMLDINAVEDLLKTVSECLLKQKKVDKIDPFLEKASDIIDDPRFRVRIEGLRRMMATKQ